jgi:hypothetical protein
MPERSTMIGAFVRAAVSANVPKRRLASVEDTTCILKIPQLDVEYIN